MTFDNFPQHLTGRLIEFSKIIAAVTMISTATLGAWAWAWGPVGDFFEEFNTLVTDVAQLKGDVARATGDDRVIRQTPDMSYVKEPVYRGENVILYLVISRTLRGKHCRLVEWVPLFTDERGVIIAGVPAEGGPPRQQVSTEAARLRLEIDPPDGLSSGRVELHLVLTYVCFGETAFDRTDSVVYELLPGSRPTTP